MEPGVPVRRAGWVAAFLVLGIPLRGSAQISIGEVRLMGVAGFALRPDPAQEPAGLPALPARTLPGLSASLSLIHRGFSVGPEAMVLRGSDRRMYALGGVARLQAGSGRLRPFILIGAGSYSWDRKMVLAFAPAGGAVWTGDVTGFTGSLGGGLILGGRRTAMVVEARGHKNLGHGPDFGARDLLTISAGGRFSW